MNDHERIEFLQGQVQCLLTLSFALIESHQDKKRLQALVETNLDGISGKFLGEPVQEALLEGFEDVKARILKYVSSAAERQ